MSNAAVFMFFVVFYGLAFYATLFVAYPRAGTVCAIQAEQRGRVLAAESAQKASTRCLDF